MICIKCGELNMDKAAYCSKCGSRLPESENLLVNILQDILEEIKSLNTKMGTRTSESLPDVITVEDLMSFLQCGRNRALEIINNKHFEQLKLGRKKGISKLQFSDWWERQQRLKGMKLVK